MRIIFLVFILSLSFPVISNEGCVQGISLERVCEVGDWKSTYSSSTRDFTGALWELKKNKNVGRFVAGKVQKMNARNLKGFVSHAKSLFEEKDFKYKSIFSKDNIYIAALSSSKFDLTFYQGYFKNYKNEIINLNCMGVKWKIPWGDCRHLFEEIAGVSLR